MSLPRLHGPRTSLLPVPHAVAVAVLSNDHQQVREALLPLAVTAGPGWPHADTADALRPYAEHGSADQDSGVWLLVVDAQVVGDLGWLGGPAEDGDCELGYGLAAPSREQGLGTEAVGVLAGWAERQPGVHRLTAEVLQGNEASCRLLTRLGFRAEPAVAPYLLFSRAAPGHGAEAVLRRAGLGPWAPRHTLPRTHNCG